MSTAVEVLAALLLLAGSLLAVLAGVGVLRFPDVFARMHAATKAATLGLVCIVGGASLLIGNPGDVAKLVLVAVLLFITAPISAHMVGRAAYGAGTEMSDHTAVDELGEHG
ncbi:MAG TPA: monovalent cation/H(+) antiporter subunit G [Acidimicrobiales bacterium]|nr:monovalent cation/H(+) antiporter subunit G [Acidimicrobiales bacterium]